MRSDHPIEAAISFGPFRLYPAARLLERDGVPVHIGGRALDILIVLAEQAGNVVGKRELVDRVWSDVTVDEGSLRFHVTGLRKALGDGQSGARYIANVPGRGYSLVAPVSRSVPQPAPGAKANPPPHPQSLPARLPRMIGRDDTVLKITEALSAHRFVSIVGPGGIGKTTVATAVGHALLPEFDGEILFVDLAPLGEPKLVPGMVASKLGLTLGADDPVESLAASVRDMRLLLILDNCEHVIELVAVLAEALFNTAPSVNLLVTSRESLRVEGERIHRLFPLQCPPEREDLRASDVLEFPAARLFVDRASAAAGEFRLDDADAPAVADICLRLDGIPLALELAAARADVFGIKELATRLDDRLLLTTRGRRTAMPRHQTLRATLDWSYELLDERERILLRRLAIFPGPFSLEAAGAIAAGGEAASVIIERLLGLVAKSLVVAVGGAGVTGYRLLETTRAYAAEKLADSGESQPLARRHAEYFRDLFERAQAEWDVRPTSELLADYGREIDNLRAAIDWAFSPDGDARLGVALTTAAVPLWTSLPLLDECRNYVGRALAALAGLATGDAHREMKLHAALGASLVFTGDSGGEVEAAWMKTLRLAEALGDVDHQLRALWGLWVVQDQGAIERAREFSAVATTPADRLMGARLMGVSYHFLGDQPQARDQFERVLANDLALDPGWRLSRYLVDNRPYAQTFLTRVLWLQGLPARATQLASSMIEELRASDHANALCEALTRGACPVALWVGDPGLAEYYIDLLRHYSARHMLSVSRTFARAYEGALMIQRGDLGAGIRLLGTSLAELDTSFGHYRRIEFIGRMADALGQAGQIPEGLAAIDHAIARSARTSEAWVDAELFRIKGELTLLRGTGDAMADAEGYFRHAIELAYRQGALAWELRAARSFARALRDGGRAGEAVAILRPVYGRFTEGFETADLRAAKLLLDDLG